MSIPTEFILLLAFRNMFLMFLHIHGTQLDQIYKFYIKRIDFLVIVDYFSKYLLMRKIANSTSSAVIKE